LYNKGYTLLELLTVVTIISLLVIISPISRSAYRIMETLITVQNMKMDLRWARYKAIDENRELRIRIYRDAHCNHNSRACTKDYMIYDVESLKVVKKGNYPGYLILYKNLNAKKVTANYYERIKFRYDGTALHGTVGLKYGNNIYKIVVSQLGRVRVVK